MNARRRDSDEGATLLLVLIIVSLVSVVVGVMLSSGETAEKTTDNLRTQASDVYAADAAGQAALTQLRNGTLTCNTAGGTSLNLGTSATPFYSPSVDADRPLNAATTCVPDTSPSQGATTTTTTSGSGVGIGGSTDNLPAYALLAMRKNSTTSGIVFPQSNKTICIENGKVASNSAIDATNNTIGLRITGTGTANDCSTGSTTNLAVQAHGLNGTGGCLPNKTVAFKPTNCTDMAGTISVPTAPTPTDPIARTDATAAAVCKTVGGVTYAAFRPGRFTDVSLLNSPCSGGPADFEWFSPGTYYFDFGATTWQWPTTLLGGTPTSGASTTTNGVTTTPAITSVDPTNAGTLGGLSGIAAFPTGPGQPVNSCADPSTQSQYPGIEFVFGGRSTFAPNISGNAELCGSYDPDDPPIAIYGASSTVSVSGGSVSPETLCTGPAACSDANPSGVASLINLATQPPNGKAQFYIKGFVYAPTAPITLGLRNSNGQIFNWGVVVWTFSLDVNGSSPPQPFIKLPSPNQGFTQTTTTTYAVRYLKVWTCVATASPCSTSGVPDLVARVQQSGATYKVLSWSHAN